MKFIISAASKGGVGKSIVSINLAFALKRLGYRTALLDTDITMPAIVKYLKLEHAELETRTMVEPLDYHGVQVLSPGLVMDPDQPVIINSEKREKLVGQFIEKTHWMADYLIIDTPPGSTDELQHITKKLKQSLHGVVVVTTPSAVAISQVRRSIEMFKRLDAPIIGLIGNMTNFECIKCHTINDVYGRDGENPVKKLTEDFRIPLLAELPIYPKIDDEPLHFADQLAKSFKANKVF
jgi:ATP-binding protein involved in chromosome partitioning